MQREEALRRAIEDARGRRARELEDVVSKQTAMRRRLRELQDRLLALGTVHERFAKPAEVAATSGSPPVLTTNSEASSPATPPEAPAVATVVTEVLAPQIETSRTPAEVRTLLAPPKRDEATYGSLLASLANRHPDGFTVSQMRDVMDYADPEKPHSYDSAWSLANTLFRSNSLELAGTRPGPSGVPIRVYRVPRPPGERDLGPPGVS